MNRERVVGGLALAFGGAIVQSLFIEVMGPAATLLSASLVVFGLGIVYKGLE